MRVRLWLVLGCAAWCLSGKPAGPRIRNYNVTRAGEAYGITVAVMAPEAFASGKIAVTIGDAQGPIAAQVLDAQDLDFYVSVKPRRAGDLSVRLDAAPALLDAAKVKVEFAPLSLANAAAVALQPNGDPKAAQVMEPGQTIFGADDGAGSGFQWFRFVARERKLVYFVLHTPDRKAMAGVDVFDEELNPYTIGTPGYSPGATQNFPGPATFRTRVVERGATCYVRVAAKGLSFRLRTELFDVPPQKDPQLAIRIGKEFLEDFGGAGHDSLPPAPSVSPEDVERITRKLLSAQKEDGSWQDGFNTQVRETALAVETLSRFYPQNGAAPVLLERARTEHLDELLADLEYAPAAQVKRVLNESSWVLAREAAAKVLGRIKDRDAIPSLERALGDPSKLVQRAAALALLAMDAIPALAAALHSGNGRVRSGALRALQQSEPPAGNAELVAAVKAALQDAVPQNRAMAANVLSGWNH